MVWLMSPATPGELLTVQRTPASSCRLQHCCCHVCQSLLPHPNKHCSSFFTSPCFSILCNELSGFYWIN
ncbi:hypothetical protein PAXRUDRAFT_481903 [Paxillus rubicundulus Ve08.2h10]|uniref:Uncharacterized protein n=1 Tax=Paxillus rubicundulus Ve08.2h10 TaxID=930991 RepID=A0A0D0E7H2_9AGAM|nr:hypothetical protein PAXRUDRAFT_481903 [Paxillus rubicundulus Ve08.2h10]